MTWTLPTGPGATKTIHATFHGKKLRVQTPVCRCKVFKDTASAALYLYFDDSTLHRDFEAYVHDLESFAAEMSCLHHLESRSCLRTSHAGTSMRFNVWESTQWYDEDGEYLKESPQMRGCSCIVEFRGCWVSQTGWGLKWNVVQIKQARPPPPVQPACMILDDLQDQDDAYAFIE